MKATVIISHEYELNSPTIFVYVHDVKNYYGDLLYVESRNYPNVEYWNNATSSDSHRGFTVKDVTITSEQFTQLQKLHRVVEVNKSMIIRSLYPIIPKKWTVRRGHVYEQWKKEYDEQSFKIRQEHERNDIFEKPMYYCYKLRKELILSLLNG